MSRVVFAFPLILISLECKAESKVIPPCALCLLCTFAELEKNGVCTEAEDETGVGFVAGRLSE